MLASAMAKPPSISINGLARLATRAILFDSCSTWPTLTASRRRISSSGRIYNTYSNPPAVPGICDEDGTPLVQRPDDSEAVFIERMKTFESQTAPVVEHYRRQGRFEEIDGDQPVEQVTAAIEAALKRLRATKN